MLAAILLFVAVSIIAIALLGFLIWTSSGGQVGQNRPPSGMPAMPPTTNSKRR